MSKEIRRFEAGLSGVSGATLGCGKTAFLVYMGLQHHLGGRYVISNFHVEFADDVKPLEIILSPGRVDEYKNTTILGDEGYTVLESRGSGQNLDQTRIANRVVLTGRKNRNSINLSSQLPGMIDLRFRQQTNYKVMCSRKGPDMTEDPVKALDSRIRAAILGYSEKAHDFIGGTTMKFRVREVAKFYDTEESIEGNIRLKIHEIANIAREFKNVAEYEGSNPNKEEEWSLMYELENAKNDSKRKEKLRVYLDVPGYIAGEVLQVLEPSGGWHSR